MNENMTALMSCFVRGYHAKNSNIKIHNDYYANKILGEELYNNIYNNLSSGIEFFNKDCSTDPVLWIVNNQLGPTVIGRSSFNGRHLLNEINLGLRQYVVFASGYDTSSYMVNDKVKVFEIDTYNMINDKISRVKSAGINNDNVCYIGCELNNYDNNVLISNGFNVNDKSFCSLLGISYYLDKDVFFNLIRNVSNILTSGSCILFDYPNDRDCDKESVNEVLASGASCSMKSHYSYDDIVSLCEECNLLIYEHLDNTDIDRNYFYNYNTINDVKIKAFPGVSFCLLAKRC